MYEPREPKPGTVGAAARLRARPAAASLEEGRVVCESLRDTDSIRKAAGRAKMVILLDYQVLQKAAGTEFLSRKIRREYGCQEKQIRTLAYSLFSLNMEHGDLVRSYNQPQKWEMVKPDSLEEVEWKVACSE